MYFISIHAPREGGDYNCPCNFSTVKYFNPRPPRGGRLRMAPGRLLYVAHFNPRPPRGGRQRCPWIARHFIVISIHAPREGGDVSGGTVINTNTISIHAPREGGDDDPFGIVNIVVISIHAPREGGDGKSAAYIYFLQNFNPRPPRGGRRGGGIEDPARWKFQSTPPARGATLLGAR